MYASLYYLDPHPTNCVAGPVCPANTGRGYPRFTFTRGIERGYYNLAVFMLGCPLDCAFCQNWEHKTLLPRVQQGYAKSEEELLAAALDERVTCVCYFGGDPTPHAPLLISLSRRIVEAARKRGSRIPRICWETDGLVAPALMREMARLSLETGGIIKVDWKAWSPSVYEALTGVDGRRALERLKENTRIVARMAAEREEPPLLVVSILLVPGYVDAAEVRGIAGYVRRLEEESGARIPMVLLAFHGEHLMRDLPPTSRRHMEEALKAAKEAGASEVYVGNEWLLGNHY
jgi:pyruvate formate lyase activating enzyme